MTLTKLTPDLRATLLLGLPLIGSHLARMAIGVSDTVMVGWYGVEPLAALVIATSVFFILFMLGSGYGIGVMGLLATARARDDDTEMRRATRMALWLSTLHAVLMMPLMWHAGPILRALGQEPVIAAAAQDYLRIVGFSMAPVLWGMVLNSYLAALGRANVVMIVTLLGLPLNIALNWALIFGHWGAPELGVRGAAVASLSVNLVQLIVLLAYALWLPMARRYALMQRFWRPDWPGFRAIFRLGLPVGVTLVAEVGMFVGVNLMMGWIGARELAAHGIALQLASMAFMVHLGLSNAATIRVGETRGRGDGDGMRRAALAALMLSLGFAVICAALFLWVPGLLVGLYLDQANPEADVILRLAVGFMFWAALFQLADAMQAMMMGMLRGVQDTRVPMILAAISYWAIGLSAGYLLAFPLGGGGDGLWAGLLIGLSVAAVLMGRRFFGGLRAGAWLEPQP